MPEARILLVEDDAVQRGLLTQILASAGYAVGSVASAEAALAEFVEGKAPDLVLSDWRLANGKDGLALLATLRERVPDVGFVLITAYGTIAHAVEALRLGVDDYLAKPFERATLLLAIERTLRSRRLTIENRRLSEQLAERDRLLDLLGRSKAMQAVYRLLERIAAAEGAVLVLGESGSGKELAARALHALSARARGPFVAVNCAALPEALLEAEFFGVKRGAYTGALADRRGCFAAAHGGTLFLDEIGELPLSLQPKLLRVLDSHRVTPLGASVEETYDVRIVAATKCDLRAAVGEGRFREDLWWRLGTFLIELPPLRARREDLPMLVDHFLSVSARAHHVSPPRLAPGLRKVLLDHPWPGNVRELANTLERIVVLAEGGEAGVEHLPPAFLAPERATEREPFLLPPRGIGFDELEKSALRQALSHANGNRKLAASLLGMPYKAFLYRLDKFGIVAVPGSTDPRSDPGSIRHSPPSSFPTSPFQDEHP